MMPLFAQQGTWWPQLLVAVLVGAVAFMGLGRAAAEAPASASFASLSLTALGASAAVGLCGSALVAQLLGMVAAVNGLMALLGLWRPALRPGQGALAASLLTTEALLLYGFSYLDMSTPAVLLVGLLPLVALASTRAQGRLKPALVSLGVGGLLLLPAAWLSYQVGFSTEQGYDNPASDQEQGGYGYGDAHTEAGYGYEQEGSGDSAGAYGYGGAHTGGGQ
jgi:hypothetical protein